LSTRAIPFPRLPSAGASHRVIRAIERSGRDGITTSDLWRLLAPITKSQLKTALARLHSSGLLTRTRENRITKRGQLVDQIVWRQRTRAG